jgi:hypothetical protein
VSPLGISYIGASKEKLGQAACCAVKRINLDNRIAKRAAATGANLKEGFEVGVGERVAEPCISYTFLGCSLAVGIHRQLPVMAVESLLQHARVQVISSSRNCPMYPLILLR